jgi:hypothetical protein
MAFSIAQQTSVTATEGTSHSIVMPTHASGDRLLLIACFDGTATTITAGVSGWTPIFAADRVVAYEKVAASASEPTVTATSSASEQMAAVVYAITGAHASTASQHTALEHPSVDGPTFGFTNLALSSWSGEETLYISGVGYDRSASTTMPSAGYSTSHTGLTANFQSSGTGGGAAMATQYRIVTADSQDPSDWTASSARISTDFVIAIRPTASGGLTKYLKLLAHSSAASASSIAGAVFSEPAGSDIAGDKIGEFTGGAFGSLLEGGQAVLKVAVTEFGGTALTTSDAPVALVRNTSNTTGIVSCTVIEE